METTTIKPLENPKENKIENEQTCKKDKSGNCIITSECNRGVKKRCFGGKKADKNQCFCKDDKNYSY